MSDQQTPPPSSEEERAPSPTAPQRTPVTQQLGRVVVIAAAVLFLVFAAINSQYVAFSWVFGETDVIERNGERVSGGVPLILLLVFAFVLGAVVGAGLAWRRRRTQRRSEREDATTAGRG